MKEIPFGPDEQKNLERRLEALSRTRAVSLRELFHPAFMRRYTRVSSLEELLALGDYQVHSESDIESIPREELDALIASHTSFSSWDDMRGTAASEWAERRLL